MALMYAMLRVPKHHPSPLLAFIHSSAGKGNSPMLNFRFTELSEVRYCNCSQIHRKFIALCFPETRSLQRLCQGA
jgi:hypothetical protein